MVPLLLLLGPGLLAAQAAPPSYDFNYTVSDAGSGQLFGQEEARRGARTSGQYQVQLPDGRLQIVTYRVADPASGYVAAVTYTGEAVPAGRGRLEPRRTGGHLRPDRVLGRLVARPSRVRGPATRPQLTRTPKLLARPAQRTARPRLQVSERPQLVARPQLATTGPKPPARKVVSRPTPKLKLTARPTSRAKLTTSPAGRTKPARTRLQTTARPEPPARQLASRVSSTVPRSTRRPKALQTRPTPSTTPPPPPPTYIPARHPALARDAYRGAYHTSESRVLYSLFREDIKGQMKLPPKGGEEEAAEEKKRIIIRF